MLANFGRMCGNGKIFILIYSFVFQDVDASEIKVQVCVYAFDLLYLNGEVRMRETCSVLSVNRKVCVDTLL